MKRAAMIILLAGLAWLAWFSFHLAGIRIYQVDECQNVYVAHILASGQAKNAFTSISLFLFPLIWLSHGATHAVDFFIPARFFMLEVFWLNICLIALATGERLFSLRGLVALAGAATLAPLWDYGFEIRHDNLILTGLLLTWCAVRVRPGGLQSYFIAGILAAGLEFLALKTFVYTIPITLAILVFPPPAYKSPRWKLALSWTAGALLVCLAVRIGYGEAGIWNIYVQDFKWIFGYATNASLRFAPWFALKRLLYQTPLLLALTVAAVVAVLRDLRKGRTAALNWEGNLPECLLFLVALGALFANPTPFPYNLVQLVPYAYIFAFRESAQFLERLPDGGPIFPVAAALIIFTHLIPFELATRRHLSFTNFHQENVMRMAEALTDPKRDPVYDGIGMVPTRPSINREWFLHSSNISTLIYGKETTLHGMLKANPAAVLIQSYRTDWLTKQDRLFIWHHYVPLEDDLWVLGSLLPPGGGTFTVIHSGRYRVSTLRNSGLETAFVDEQLQRPLNGDTKLTGTLDGKPITDAPLKLTAGTYRLETTAGCQPAVVWLGPHLNRPPSCGPADHRFLFVNWY